MVDKSIGRRAGHCAPGHTLQVDNAMTFRDTPILLVCALVATSTGCQVLGIPSYRAETGHVSGHMPGSPGLSEQPTTQLVCDGDSCREVEVSEFEVSECGEMGAPRVLPPLPGWLGRWHAKKELPDAPEYPRFQPLPTRPMFSQAPEVAVAPIGYGDFPATESW